MQGDQLKAAPESAASAVIEPALKVGVACGATGFLVGGTAGILASPTPVLFATFSSLQWFVLGTTFWGTRSSILQAWTSAHQTPSDLTKASAIAGGFTGGVVGGLIRGRRNVLPGMLMLSLAGYAGQWAKNQYDAARARREGKESSQGFWKGRTGKGWSLMKIMSDEEYAERLRNEQLAVDVEISVLEDKIAALRKQQEDEEAPALKPSSPRP